MSSEKRIAVIGAGPTGLSTLKNFRDYGYTTVLFEKEESIGGLWNYKSADKDKLFAPLPDPSRPINSCYFSLVMNTTKSMSQYSDYPAPESAPSFMSHSDFLHYMKQYASHFNLEDHIKFNCTVTKLSPVKDAPSSSKRWNVFYKKGDVVEMETFDNVVIATSKFPNIRLPTYPGMDQFQGIMIHSAQVRQDDLFDGKRVLIVGGSFSATEMVDIALKSGVKNLYWSVSFSPDSRNRLMFDRLRTNSGNWDENITRHDYLENPEIFSNKFASWLQPITQRENDSLYKCPPVLDRLIITNTDNIQRGLLSGRLTKVAPIKSFSHHSVMLSDDTTIHKIDVVIFCTGFVSKFPFLDDLWNAKQQSESILYRHMLPLESQLHGIAFVGLSYSLSSLYPIAEMQSRWLAHFWANRTYNPYGTLYSEKEMKEFQASIKSRVDSLVSSEPYNHIQNPYAYVEILAEEIGCQPPDTKHLMSTDKQLALALLHGPLISAQYRIVGPHSWVGARECIIKTSREILGNQKWQELLKIH